MHLAKSPARCRTTLCCYLLDGGRPASRAHRTSLMSRASRGCAWQGRCSRVSNIGLRHARVGHVSGWEWGRFPEVSNASTGVLNEARYVCTSYLPCQRRHSADSAPKGTFGRRLTPECGERTIQIAIGLEHPEVECPVRCFIVKSSQRFKYLMLLSADDRGQARDALRPSTITDQR